MQIASDRAVGPAVHISKMTGKLVGLYAINTNTLSNAFCKTMHETKGTICSECYSLAMLKTYRAKCVPAFERNSEALSERVLTVRELPVINAKYFRFHGHGELINQTHLHNLCAIAAYNPDTTFALWTKRKDMVRAYPGWIPPNMILIYSAPVIDRVLSRPPRGFHKVFNTISTGSVEPANCTGQTCMSCLKCYHHDGDSVIVEHVK